MGLRDRVGPYGRGTLRADVVAGVTARFHTNLDEAVDAAIASLPDDAEDTEDNEPS